MCEKNQSPESNRPSATERMAWFWATQICDETEDAMREVTKAMREGEPVTAEHVRDLRSATRRLRWLTEEFLAEKADDDDVEPWGDGLGGKVPYGVIREQLEH